MPAADLTQARERLATAPRVLIAHGPQDDGTYLLCLDDERDTDVARVWGVDGDTTGILASILAHAPTDLADALTEVDRLTDRVAELEEGAAPAQINLGLVRHYAAWQLGADPTASYEHEADLFHAATGLMAPGKSAPLDYGGDIEERRKAWATWTAQRREENARSVLALVDRLASLEHLEASQHKARARDVAGIVAWLRTQRGTAGDGVRMRVADAIESGDWHDGTLPADPRDARIAALEAEVASLRAVDNVTTLVAGEPWTCCDCERVNPASIEWCPVCSPERFGRGAR